MATRGSPLSAETKKCIVSVKKYFDQCKKEVEEEKFSSVQRTANALGVGAATVKRMMATYNHNPDLLEKETCERGRPPHAISYSIQTVVRSYIRKANQEGRHITLEILREHLEESAPEQSIYVRTLGRTLDRWGFAFGKGTRSQHLKEKDHVIAARQRYLREKRANRKGDSTKRPEVYLDESYVNKNHSNDFTWYSGDDGPWIQKANRQRGTLDHNQCHYRRGMGIWSKVDFQEHKENG